MFEIYKPTYNITPSWLLNTLTALSLLVAVTVILNLHQRHPHPTLVSVLLGASGALAVLIAYRPWRRNPTVSNQRTLAMTANIMLLLFSILRLYRLA